MVSDKYNKAVCFALILLFGTFIAFNIVNPNNYIWLLVVVAIFTPFLIISNALSLVILILFIFIAQGVFGGVLGILPRQVAWTSDAIIGFLFLKSILSTWRNKNFRKTPLFLPLLLFFLWAISSGVLNGISWFTIGVTLKDFFKYALLFYTILNLDIEEKTLKLLVTLFLVIMFLQIPVTVFQYRLYGQHDWVSGTLGRHGTGEMLILVGGTISILTGFFLHYRSRFIYLLGISYLLIPLILGSARAALFYIPLTIVFIIRKSLHGKLFTKTFEMFLILGIFVGFVLMVPFLREPFNSLITDTIRGLRVQVNAAVLGSAIPGRLRAPRIAVEWINRETLGSVIGYGFGSTKQSYFEEYTGKFYQTYSPRTNQLSSTLIEMGYPGLVFYFFLIFVAFAMNLRFFRNTKDNYWKAISFGVDGIIFMHLVGILYQNIWRSVYSSFPFWFFLAVIYSVGKKKGILT